MSRSRAYEFIASSIVVENVRHAGQTPNARQATELAKLPADQQAEVWQQVCDEHGAKVTAAKVKQAVDVATDKGGRTSRKLPDIRKLMQLMAHLRNIRESMFARLISTNDVEYLKHGDGGVRRRKH